MSDRRSSTPAARVVSRLALPMLLVVGLAACGGSSEEEQRQRLAEDLVEETDGALDDDTARCVADGLHEQYGDDSFEEVREAAADGARADEDVRTGVIDIFAACDALEPIIDEES